MAKLMLGGFLICAVACAACNGDSSSSPTGTTSNPFVGKWACSDELSLMFTSPAGIPTQTQMQMLTLNIAESGGVLTANTESDSGTGCSVSFTSSGSTATLSDGQTCTTAQGIALVYKSGSATVSGSALNLNFSFDASGNIPFGGQMIPAMATGTETSTCSRLSAPPTGGGGGTTTGGW